MRNLFAVFALVFAAAPASSEPFHYTSFAQISAAPVSTKVAEAKRLKTLLELFFESADSDDLKETVKATFFWDKTTKALAAKLPYLAGGQIDVAQDDVYDRFQQTRGVFYDTLASIAKLDPADPDLKALADWGYNRYCPFDPVLPGHHERLISDKQKEDLKLK